MLFMFSWLKLYSLVTFLFTILFMLLNFFIITENKIHGINIKQLIEKSTLINHVIFMILLISRTYAALPKTLMREYAILSAVILFFFNYVRFIFVADFLPATNMVYLFVFIVYVTGLVNGIMRLSINLGTIIDGDKNNNIVYTWEYIPKFFKRAASHVQQHSAQNPLPNNYGNETLKRFGLLAGIAMLPVVAYSTYEIYLSRKANEVTANSAQAMAKAKQQKTDILAVKHGLLSVEEYEKKYPK